MAQGPRQQRTFTGTGADEDIVVASARGYISALNKLIAFIGAANKQAEALESADGASGPAARPQQLAMVA